MSLSFKKTCNVAIASVALAVSQHFAGEKVYQGSCFVKEAGALNMKLQMQRSVLAEGTAKSRVPPPRRDDVAVNVVNYSYTGHRSSGLQEKGVDPSVENVVIVDPAGAHYMESGVRGYQAGGLSAILYRLIRSDGKERGNYGGDWMQDKTTGQYVWNQNPTGSPASIPLPAEASTNLKEAGDAFYVDYNNGMANDGVELTNKLSVIHSIGPDGQVYKEESINDFKEILFHTYANAFAQFRDRCDGKKELWINPVSSGVFAPSWMKANGKWESDEYLKEFAELTAEAVNVAIYESKIQGVAIKMHIFDQYEFRFFKDAFKQRFEYTDASVVERPNEAMRAGEGILKAARDEQRDYPGRQKEQKLKLCLEVVRDYGRAENMRSESGGNAATSVAAEESLKAGNKSLLDKNEDEPRRRRTRKSGAGCFNCMRRRSH